MKADVYKVGTKWCYDILDEDDVIVISQEWTPDVEGWIPMTKAEAIAISNALIGA